MITMFIQLRRVVYLLVLLQCCACVAYAQSGDTTPTDSEEKKIIQNLTELRAKMEKKKDEINVILVSLKSVKNECSEASKRAQNAAKTAEELESVVMNTSVLILQSSESLNESEVKEELRNAVYAVREATNAVEKTNLIAEKISNLAHEIQKGEIDLVKVVDDVEWITDDYINNEDETSLSGGKKKIQQLAKECKKETKEVDTFLQHVNEDTRSARSLAEEAQKQAEAASAAAEYLQKIIDDIFERRPQIKADLEREIEEENQRLTDTTTANEGKEPLDNNEVLDGALPNKQNETGSHANAQQQQNQQNSENKNEESNVETQENNNSSQSKTPTPSNSSASGSSPSQNTPTNTS
ncbi:uncharacterized protein TM35_000122770, partial [Trypanosoma theileri]